MSDLCSSTETAREKIALLREAATAWESILEEDPDVEPESFNSKRRGEVKVAELLLDSPLGREVFSTVFAEYIYRLKDEIEEVEIQELLVASDPLARLSGIYIKFLKEFQEADRYEHEENS